MQGKAAEPLPSGQKPRCAENRTTLGFIHDTSRIIVLEEDVLTVNAARRLTGLLSILYILPPRHLIC
jgi:hypothetical protein